MKTRESNIMKKLIVCFFVLLFLSCLPRSAECKLISAERTIFIAHALGGIKGYTYTNSMEAFLFNYNLGFRIFEVDLALTSDERLVCFHAGNENFLGISTPVSKLTLDEVVKLKFRKKFNVISFESLLREVNVREDVILITDTKIISSRMLLALYREIRKVNPELIKRIVLQFYQPEDYFLIKRVEKENGQFGGLIYTLYQRFIPREKLFSFVEGTGLKIVTMPYHRYDENTGKTLHELGVLVFIHTLNDPVKIRYYLEKGVDGIYTDFYFSEKQKKH